MRCVLFPHEFDELPGVGDYAGQRYRVCIHCGKTEEITDTGRSESTARNGTPLSRPTMPGSASPQACCAEDPVNRPDLESTSAEIVGTCPVPQTGRLFAYGPITTTRIWIEDGVERMTVTTRTPDDGRDPDAAR